MLHAAGGHARYLARVLVPRRILVRYRRWPCSPLASSSSLTSPSLQRLASVPPPSSRRQYSVIAAAARGSQATAAAAAASSSATADARPAARELAPAAPPLVDSARGPRQAPPLTLYDSMARTKRAFEPRAGGEPVSMYVCGVTVYDFSHVGKFERGSGGGIGDGKREEQIDPLSVFTRLSLLNLLLQTLSRFTSFRPRPRLLRRRCALPLPAQVGALRALRQKLHRHRRQDHREGQGEQG